MSQIFTLNAPFNSVSFGQVSVALAREVFRQGIKCNIIPIGNNIDLQAYKIDQDFGIWLQNTINGSLSKHNRNDISTKLWHINQGLESVSKEQNLITFLETSECTESEVNILKNQKTVFVTSNFTKRIMNDYGIKAKYLELGFDSDNFYKIDRKYYNDGSITFGLFGKLEVCRKAHGKILRAWCKKYGNNPKYRLHAAIFNPHIHPDQQQAIINNELQGNRYNNIIFLPYVKTNAEYNDIVNSIDIVIGLSRGEGRDLPVYHSVGLGKHCVGLRAHAYLDYLDDGNAVLINPNGKIKAQDGIFFHGDNSPFNRGSFYDWAESDAIEAFTKSEERFNINPVNFKGLELQNRTYKDTLNTLINEI